MSVCLWSSVLGFCGQPTVDTTTDGALKQLEAPFIHRRHALQLELQLHFHVLPPLTYLSSHSKDYIFGEGRLIHLTLEGKKGK